MEMHATLGGALPTPAPVCPHAPHRRSKLIFGGGTECRHRDTPARGEDVWNPKTPYRAFLLILWLVRRRDASAARDRLS